MTVTFGGRDTGSSTAQRGLGAARRTDRAGQPGGCAVPSHRGAFRATPADRGVANAADRSRVRRAWQLPGVLKPLAPTQSTVCGVALGLRALGDRRPRTPSRTAPATRAHPARSGAGAVMPAGSVRGFRVPAIGTTPSTRRQPVTGGRMSRPPTAALPTAGHCTTRTTTRSSRTNRTVTTPVIRRPAPIRSFRGPVLLTLPSPDRYWSADSSNFGG